VAARDRSRAEKFAARHGIPRVLPSYDELLADPDIDAVYNPLPNGLHGVWTIRAIEAGKHVLCEKPFTADAAEAERVAAVAARAPNLVVMEAFHYRYHPLVTRLRDIVAGDLGEVRRIEAWMCIPLLRPGDIRWDLGLAGGTTMDVGCYTIHLVRTLAGAEPEVVSAKATELRPDMDRRMTAELAFADGRTGHIDASMLSTRLVALGCRVTGSRGTLQVSNPYAPQFFHRIVLRSDSGVRRERVTREPTYVFQLRAFAGAVLRGEPYPTDVDDAVANMRVIDAVYRAAGMSPRQATATG
jgi:predicted dehydrogenase